MARDTATLAQLRQSIGRELNMPFYARYNTNSTLTEVTDTLTIGDSALTQRNGYWNNSWLLMTSGNAKGDVRKVDSFTSNNDRLLLDRALSATPTVGDTYELLSLWSPQQVKDAINRSILDSRPSFFQLVTDETMVLEEDKMEYDVSGLGTDIWLIAKMWVEMNTRQKQMNVTASTDGSVTVSGDVSDVTSAWKVSTYSGTGSGQLRSVSSVSGQVVSISADWTTNPDTTTMVNIWNPTVQEAEWYRLFAVRFDQKEYTTKFYLPHLYRGNYGLRFRIQYLAYPDELSTDDDTTIVPVQFLIHATLAKLYNSKADNNRIDRSMFENSIQRNYELAEQVRRMQRFTLPEITRWMEADDAVVYGHGSGYGNPDNPMSWR